MINKIRKTIWLPALLLASTLFFFSCQKELSGELGGNPTNPTTLDLTTKVTAAKISGYVTDENNLPVEGAQVQAGTAFSTTDEFGYFQFRNTEVVKNAAVVTVKKSGYFNGIKTFIAQTGKSVVFRIKLLPKTTQGTFTANAGGEVSLSNGMKISFPVDAVVNAGNNSTYNGTVTVAAQWIDPTANDLPMTMPGDLRGLDEQGSPKILTTYGMAAVELIGSAGEQLQLASGKKATLTMPLPSAIQGTAPASIPLWHFNESTGLWEEEGSATKTGNTYVGEVSHFSFWNCDVPAVYVHVDLNVVDANGNPIPNAVVKISRVSNPFSAGWAITDSSGYAGGAIPGNENLKLEIFNYYNCGSALYSQTFTTTTTDLSLGNITIGGTNLSYSVVTGSVTDCSNNPVTNGYVMMNADGLYYRYDLNSSGGFSFDALICSGTAITANLIAIDFTNNQQSPQQTITLIPGNVNAGTLQACGLSIQTFINLSVDGVPNNFTGPADTVYLFSNGQSPNGILGALSSSSANNMNASIDFTSGLALNGQYPVLSCQSNNLALIPQTTVTATITELGAVGEFISGNFTGTFMTQSPPVATYTMSCSFRVRRSF